MAGAAPAATRGKAGHADGATVMLAWTMPLLMACILTGTLGFSARIKRGASAARMLFFVFVSLTLVCLASVVFRLP